MRLLGEIPLDWRRNKVLELSSQGYSQRVSNLNWGALRQGNS